MMPEFSERSFSRVIGLPARVDPDAHPIVEALSDSRYQRRAAFGVVPCHKILRVGHGFRNFRNYWLRLLLHCGITSQHRTQHHCQADYHPLLCRGRFLSIAS
jgi:hypothetical protein